MQTNDNISGIPDARKELIVFIDNLLKQADIKKLELIQQFAFFVVHGMPNDT